MVSDDDAMSQIRADNKWDESSEEEEAILAVVSKTAIIPGI